MSRSLIVTDINFENWVLGGISRDIESLLKPNSSRICIKSRNLLSYCEALLLILFSKYIVIVNQNTLYKLKIYRRILQNRRVTVLYTHTNSVLKPKEIELLSNARIICLNSTEKKLLMSAGIIGSRILVRPTGVDFDKFSFGVGKPDFKNVLMVSDFNERKNPEVLLNTIRICKDFKFTLIGKNWFKWDGFNELINCPNFEYHTFDHQDYLRMLKTHHIIVHKQNGFLLPKQFDAKNVKLLLNKASQVNWNTRDSIIYYNYQSYIEKFLPHY